MLEPPMNEAPQAPQDPTVTSAQKPDIHPLLPKYLGYLFIRPTKYFQEVKLGSKWAYIVAVYLIGISGAMGRIDTRLLQAELGGRDVVTIITDNWLYYWLAVLVAGSISGALSWLVLGWWYGYRARLCGFDAEDVRTPRIVWSYSHLVETIPVMALTIGYTVLFSSYTTAYYADEYWSVFLLIFPFWSCLTSYAGVRSALALEGKKVVVWFLVLPILFYLVIFGLFGVLGYFFLGGGV